MDASGGSGTRCCFLNGIRCLHGFRIESIIHDHQPEYYAAINQSNAEGEGTAFIEFMLGVIKESLEEAVEERPDALPVLQNKKETRWTKIESFLRKNAYIQNADVQQLLDVSPEPQAGFLLH